MADSKAGKSLLNVMAELSTDKLYFMRNLLKGARYLLTGFELMNQKGIRHLSYFPMAINAVLFSVAIWVGYGHFDVWLDSLIPTWLPEWIIAAIMWLIIPIFTALILIIVFFSFSIFANFLASPFNAPLAEAVEKKLNGIPPSSLSWQQLIKDTPSALWNELKKIKYFLNLLIPLFILSLVPLLNILAPILWILFSGWILTLEYHNYPMSNHHLDINEQHKALKTEPGLTLGFGLATLAITMIPILNFFVIPAAICGATALYLEKLKV